MLLLGPKKKHKATRVCSFSPDASLKAALGVFDRHGGAGFFIKTDVVVAKHKQKPKGHQEHRAWGGVRTQPWQSLLERKHSQLHVNCSAYRVVRKPMAATNQSPPEIHPERRKRNPTEASKTRQTSEEISRRKEQGRITKMMSKMATSACRSVVALNVSEVSAPTQRHWVAGWTTAWTTGRAPCACCLHKARFKSEGTQTGSAGVETALRADRGGRNVGAPCSHQTKQTLKQRM